MKDLIKREVPRAVEMSKNAGIEVKMITGDNKMTAIAIGQT